jgi:hypothetical protein
VPAPQWLIDSFASLARSRDLEAPTITRTSTDALRVMQKNADPTPAELLAKDSWPEGPERIEALVAPLAQAYREFESPKATTGNHIITSAYRDLLRLHVGIPDCSLQRIVLQRYRRENVSGGDAP